MTDTASPPAGSPRSGRPRSAASRRAILDAAYAILIEEGLHAFSIDAVAVRSGAARTTIYRSWPSKGVLAFESFREAFEARLVFERTASPEQDLRALVGSLARLLSGPAGRLAASVVAEAQSDPAVRAHFLEDFSGPLRRRSTAMIQAGIDCGRFRSDLDIPRLLDAAIGAVYLRLLFGQPIDPAWAGQLASTLLHGCLADGPGSPPPEATARP